MEPWRTNNLFAKLLCASWLQHLYDDTFLAHFGPPRHGYLLWGIEWFHFLPNIFTVMIRSQNVSTNLLRVIWLSGQDCNGNCTNTFGNVDVDDDHNWSIFSWYLLHDWSLCGSHSGTKGQFALFTIVSHSEFSSKGNLIKVKNEKNPFTAFGHKVNLWI